MQKDSFQSKGYFKDSFCIYLDQFAVSNIADGIEEWEAIKSIIEKGVHSQKIVCPMPYEHLLETSRKHDSSAITQHNYFNSICSGYVFKHIGFITAQLLISQVRKNNITKNTFLGRINPSFLYEKSLIKFATVRNEYEGMINEAASLSNQIRVVSRPNNSHTSRNNTVLLELKALEVSQFVERLEELVTTGGIVIRGVKFQTREIPHWIDYVLDVLLKKNKMKTEEGRKLLASLKKNGFDQVSTLDVRNTLVSYGALLQKKSTANDQIDIGRVSAAIQITDIMVIDKARKYELIETGLAKKYDTRIFSGKPEDVKELRKTLEEIVDS
jgi:hypothetical protein